MSDHPVAWRLHWQDFQGHVPGIGLTRPKPQHTDHSTREEAEAARAALVGEHIVATIAPVYMRTRRSREPHAAWGDMLPMQGKRLTDWNAS